MDLIAEDRSKCGDDTAPLIQIGDLVDRGPDSAGVVAYFENLTRSDPRVTVLLGNHDKMFRCFLADPTDNDPILKPGITWLHPRLGGLETLSSYGVDPTGSEADIHAQALALVPTSHRAFLANLPTSRLHGDCLFVHAGIRPGIALNQQVERDLYWIRAAFLNDPTDHGPLIVHGHTPVETAEHRGNRLAIDTGAAFGGPLAAVVIEGRQAWLLTPSGRQEIRPHAAA